ncbi:MAG: succinylglutamate desuccinylase/aspartoacylase family protein [Phycisphaerales bacterium]|nr:succinylglutamate desuccinylase/aspartoacylase family protein [Phycisphaerales bacterium]
MSKATEASTVRWTSREIGRADSGREGPTLVVLGGVHGNEPAGLHAGKRVLDALHEDQPTAMRGRVVLLAGNMRALNHTDAHTRYIDHDLNRLCTAVEMGMPSETSAEHAEMHELFAAIRAERARSSEMVLVDLHTTSADAPPVVVVEDSIRARTFVQKLGLPMYLGFEEELPGLVADRVTQELGCVSCVIEGGQHNDPRSIDVHEAVIWTAMDALGMLPIDAVMHDESPPLVVRGAVGEQAGCVYDIRHRHEITGEDFAMVDSIRSGSLVHAGRTVIAHEHGVDVLAVVRGRVFLPNRQTRRRIGDDGFFIVRRVGTGWLGLSARLRKQHWLHSVFSRLPGIYRMGDGSLMIDADIAAFCKRQVFHLLGYRLVRHDERDGGHGFRRYLRGVLAFIRAFSRGPIRGGPDADDPRFWIVRRHRLDQ